MLRTLNWSRKASRAVAAALMLLAAVGCQSEYTKHSELGKEAARAKRFDEAIKEYLLAAEAAPNEPKPYYQVAKVYRTQGKFDEAEKYYRKSLEIDPNYSHSFPDLMEVLVKLGKLDEAAKLGAEALTKTSVKEDMKESRAVQQQMAEIEKLRKLRQAQPTPVPAPATQPPAAPAPGSAAPAIPPAK